MRMKPETAEIVKLTNKGKSVVETMKAMRHKGYRVRNLKSIIYNVRSRVKSGRLGREVLKKIGSENSPEMAQILHGAKVGSIRRNISSNRVALNNKVMEAVKTLNKNRKRREREDRMEVEALESLLHATR